MQKLLNENAPLTYADYQNRVKPKKKEIPQDKKIVGWRCKICNYVYEGSELPADYICPIADMMSAILNRFLKISGNDSLILLCSEWMQGQE